MALAPYPETGPSTRFRLAQFRAPLRSRGIDLEIRSFLTADDYGERYRGKGVLWKARKTLVGMGRRARDLRDAGAYDAVIVHRELAPVANGFFRRALEGRDVPYLYDFDDAVFLPAPGSDRLLSRVRRPREATAVLCRRARVVLAGNEFLADFARTAREEPGGDGVRVLPTVIDTRRFHPGDPSEAGRDATEGGSGAGGAEAPLVVGWIGTHTTMPNLEELFPALGALATRVPFRLRVVSNRPPAGRPEGVELEFRRWSPDSEVEDTRALDVGLYPLDDTPWNRGKCGFKAIQYLACGVPAVASPVGVIPSIVVAGRTGFCAGSREEWIRHLERLLTDPGLRRALGRQGRRHVEEGFSVRAAAEPLARAIQGVTPAAGPGGGG